MTAQHSTAQHSGEGDGRGRELAVPSLFLHPHFISFLFFLLDFFPSSWLSFRVLVPCSISSTPNSSTHCQLSSNDPTRSSSSYLNLLIHFLTRIISIKGNKTRTISNFFLKAAVDCTVSNRTPLLRLPTRRDSIRVSRKYSANGF